MLYCPTLQPRASASATGSPTPARSSATARSCSAGLGNVGPAKPARARPRRNPTSNATAPDAANRDRTHRDRTEGRPEWLACSTSTTRRSRRRWRRSSTSTNKMAIPKLEKIVINMGVGKATQDKALLEAAVDSLSKISGQKPQVTKAKVSVSGFRLREGNEIGCKVTLRGRRMYEFLDRLISIALPRIRDFRGVNPNSFDGHGNYTPGPGRAGRLPRDRRRPAPAHAGHGHHDRHRRPTSDDQARELLRALRHAVPPAARQRAAARRRWPARLTSDRSP